MSKKKTVIRDELELKGGGIYCFMPYERLDAKHKAIFKIGMAINFNSRTESYHTYFPLGVYMCAFLEDPPVPRKTRTREERTKKSHYLTVESFILKYIDAHGGQRIMSTTRTRNKNANKEGETEWTYTNEDVIHEAFTEAHKKFNGKLKLFYLEGLDPESGKFTTINDIAKSNEQTKPHYAGKIIFKL